MVKTKHSTMQPMFTAVSIRVCSLMFYQFHSVTVHIKINRIISKSKQIYFIFHMKLFFYHFKLHYKRKEKCFKINILQWNLSIVDAYVTYIFEGVVVVVIVWQLDLQLPVQSVPITTKVMSSNPDHGEVYLIQHYVIKSVVFLRVLWFPPPIKLTATI